MSEKLSQLTRIFSFSPSDLFAVSQDQGGGIFTNGSRATPFSALTSSITSLAVTSVGAIGNLYTGGTLNDPIIHITCTPGFTSISANTIYSGSTDLSLIFAQASLPANAYGVLFNTGIGYTWASALSDSSQVESLDWTNRQMYDASSIDSLDWLNRFTYDSSGRKSLDWTNRHLLDTTEQPTIDWKSQKLITIGSTLTWNNGTAPVNASDIVPFGTLLSQIGALFSTQVVPAPLFPGPPEPSLTVQTGNYYTNVIVLPGAITYVSINLPSAANVLQGQLVNVSCSQASYFSATTVIPSPVVVNVDAVSSNGGITKTFAYNALTTSWYQIH